MNTSIISRLPVAAWMAMLVVGGVTACAAGERSSTDAPVTGAGALPAEAEAGEPSAQGDAGLAEDPDTDPGGEAHAGHGSATEPSYGSRASHRPAAPAGNRAPVHGHTSPSSSADARMTVPALHGSGLSQRAQEQLRLVERSVAHLDTPEKARAAGFRPMLGMIPTMGTHWVNQRRMAEGVKLEEPDHLLFSPVNGEQRLVGVAYAYIGKDRAAAPDLFDGTSDVWHDHPEFAPPGETLIMLHAWFVPSPEGSFAGHNPWLAYWAVGLQPPTHTVMGDRAAAIRARRLSLALSETVEPMQFVRFLREHPALDSLEERRTKIREMIPLLAHAQESGDTKRWNEVADAAVAEWIQIRDAYLEAVPGEQARKRLADFYLEMETGRHVGR